MIELAYATKGINNHTCRQDALVDLRRLMVCLVFGDWRWTGQKHLAFLVQGLWGLGRRCSCVLFWSEGVLRGSSI